jgi:hypothetical protein
MGDATRAAIDEGTKQDLRWFISCAHAVNGTVKIYKCLGSRLNIYVDASLKGVGGVFQNYVYKRALPDKPGWCIAYWEAINILVAVRTFAGFISGSIVNVWCDNQAAVNLLTSGRRRDPILHSIARNLWLAAAALDCELHFTHIRGTHNKAADLLSRWHNQANPTASLFQLLNDIPVWINGPEDAWDLHDI